MDGDRKGADSLVQAGAVANKKLPCLSVPAEWSKFGKTLLCFMRPETTALARQACPDRRSSPAAPVPR